jgi:hypothetical protein
MTDIVETDEAWPGQFDRRDRGVGDCRKAPAKDVAAWWEAGSPGSQVEGRSAVCADEDQPLMRHVLLHRLNGPLSYLNPRLSAWPHYIGSSDVGIPQIWPFSSDLDWKLSCPFTVADFPQPCISFNS